MTLDGPGSTWLVLICTSILPLESGPGINKHTDLCIGIYQAAYDGLQIRSTSHLELQTAVYCRMVHHTAIARFHWWRRQFVTAHHRQQPSERLEWPFWKPPQAGLSEHFDDLRYHLHTAAFCSVCGRAKSQTCIFGR